MSRLIISVSGLRGVVGESLSPETAMRFAASFASIAPKGPIVVARDGRASGPMLGDAIRSALSATGRDILDCGVAATPTVGVLVRSLQSSGGLQISASHNPPQYNGVKLFGADGRVLSASDGEKIVARYREGKIDWAAFDSLGSCRTIDDVTSEHLKLVLATVDVDRIRGKKFRVLLDANHGSGSVLGGRLLEALGCSVTTLGGSPDGQFSHPPEPTAENLAGVLQSVAQAKADVGFCQDPDADRLAVVDAAGRYLGEEYTLALCVDHVLRKNVGPVVTNCSSSRMTQDLCEKYGAPFSTSAVGEANVADEMIRTKAILGGEGAGGVIDPRVGYVRDSFVGMAMILDAMAARETTVAALADELPRYSIEKTKIALSSEQVAAALDRLAARFPEAKLDRRDGLRLDWPGRWLLVRASNTEPIVRAIAEAPTAEEAAELCRQAAEALSDKS